MNLVERVGAALVSPRRALAAAEAGRGGLPDALLLVLLKVLCSETRVLVVALWMIVKTGPGPAMAALVARIGSVIGTDLLLLAAGGVVVTIFAGKRRDATRDFDLAAVAWVPVLSIDTVATLVLRAAGIELRGPGQTILQIAAAGWMAALLVLAVLQARRRT